MPKIAKTPVVMQMEALECGAACLCMVLAYHGKWLPLEQVRRDCGVSRDGSSAVNIVRAARAYGMKASGHRMEPAGLRGAAFPAIIHWNFNHFVVLNGFKGSKAVINDPARGLIYVDAEEFDSAFTGVVLRFEKTDAFVKEGRPRSIWRFAAGRLEGAVPAAAFIAIICAVASLTGILPPIFSKIFMDDMLLGQNFTWLLPFAAAMGFMLLFEFLVSAVKSLSWYRISGRFAITANAEFMWHVLRLPMEFFSQRWAGDIAVRQDSNGRIAASLIQKTAPVLINVVFMVFYLALMFNYSITLTIVALAAVVINTAAAKYRLSRITNLSRSAFQSEGKLAGIAVSGIEIIETIKASGAENGFFARFSGYFAGRHNANVQITRFSVFFGTFIEFLQQLTTVVILMTGVSLIMDGEFTIGALLAFQGFLNSFMIPVRGLVDASEAFAGLKVEVERVEDVMNYKVDGGTGGGINAGIDTDININNSIDTGAATADKLSGAVEIKNITFGYSRLSGPLIKNFSLSIKPGSSVALVGASGCGKSTIARLITGLYKPWEGEILFDGRKREEIDSYSFRSSVAMVDQDITLFEDTVANNIRMWDTSIEDFAVIMAARDAGLHDCIVSRSNGYGHIINEGGRNFSGGQRQRLEIARVLAVEPTVIVLDEATSALDAKTEEKVTKSIKNVGAACVIIAHRLSAIRDCDEILVLDNGETAERGTHDELMAKNGRYAELISTE
ncbi:MAG: NHLP family bacteriocin export ABC transporter peptidase/permease/ATPase subunit [Chitinispirillia bacterium]|nr:NHLP family bacteriocin export ABC transporter peptidase/permease/ATPase subunit [Chitinispirillia bacterium]MCL2241821.1 NHLP family bacteriocin export ABC transporter peptidase/permease/ATPase subunit [Chitinispirillia bacterium]